MDDEFKTTLWFFGGIFLFLGVLIFGGLQIDAYSCHQTYRDQPREVRWGYTTGCQLYFGKDKGWLPSSVLREFNNEVKTNE